MVWTSKTKRRWGPVYDQANEGLRPYVKKRGFHPEAQLRYTAYSIEDIRMEPPGKAVVTIRFTVGYQGVDFAGDSPGRVDLGRRARGG